MAHNDRKKVLLTIFGIFILCIIVENIEFMVIKTDQTWIGENIICKIFCILVVAFVLTKEKLHWNELGFTSRRFFRGMLYGFSLGVVTFALSYLAEFIILWAEGKHPHLSFYISNFTMSEQNVTGTSLLAVFVCIVGNVVNVWAEEGLFRGLFIRLGCKEFSQKQSNMIQAMLFGVWHIISVVLWVQEGSMTIPQAIVMGIGYLALALILGYEWGICAMLTGTIWTGTFEHFFNNFISNTLHTVTETGADEMQIVRIVISNILSLTIVLIAARIVRKRKETTADITTA